MSYAKEPWNVVNRGDEECSDIDAKGPDGWDGDVTIAMNIGNETARRIVACVNACAGSSTEWLEFSVSEDCADLSGPFRPLETRITEILKVGLEYMAERDKLLSAMKKLSGMKLNVIADGIVDKAIAKSSINHIADAAKMVDTSIPAIVFYPAGSLGEEVEP